MINLSLHSFVWALKLLSQEIGVAVRRPNPQDILSDSDKERVVNNIKFVAQQCHKLLLASADNRLGRIYTEINAGISYVMLANELSVLAEAIEDDIKTEYFYHYPNRKGTLVLRVPGDWVNTLRGFPSGKTEVEQAVDCYACEHNTACVFHLMRVAEYGLRALARERRVKLPKKRLLEWEGWNGVIVGIRKQVDLIGNKPRGPARDAALGFDRGALEEFEGFKDAYRNNVM